MSWRWIDYDQYVEVVPVNDTKEHYAGDECWCNPRRIDEPPERPVISHNEGTDLVPPDPETTTDMSKESI